MLRGDVDLEDWHADNVKYNERSRISKQLSKALTDAKEAKRVEEAKVAKDARVAEELRQKNIADELRQKAIAEQEAKRQSLV